MKLAAKIVLVLSGLMLTLALVAGALVSRQMHDRLKEEQTRWAAALTHALGEGIVRDTLDGNALAVRETLRNLVQSDASLLYAYVLDFDGRVLSHSFDRGFPKGLTSLDRPGLASFELSTSQGPALEIVQPLLQGTRASLHLGVSQAGTEQSIQRAQRQIALTFSALLLIMLAAGALLGSRLGRPIEALTATLRRQDGAAAEAAPRRGVGGGEVAELGAAFERLAALRRQAEEERDRLATIIESATDLVSMADPRGKILYFNRAGRDMLGIGDVPASQITIAQTHPDWAGQLVLNQGIPTAIREGSWSAETALLGPDGREIPVSQVILGHRDSDGQLRYMSTIMRDISERKRAEAALRQSEERMRQASRISGIGIFDHDIATGEIYWSRELREIFGVGADEAITLATFFEQSLHPEDRARVGTAVQRSYDPAGDGQFAFEHRIIRRDGEVRWLSGRGRTLFEGEGAARRPVRSIGATLDITERKQADTALRIRDSGIAASITGMAFASLDGRLNYVNRSFLDMCGYDREDEVLGRSATDFAPDPAPVAGAITACFSHGAWSGELEGRRRDGSAFFALVSATLIRDDAGQPLQLMASFRDVTERKRAEQTILRHNQLLRTIASITELLVGEADPQRLMARLCQVLVEEGQFRMAWIGLVEAGGVRVRPAAEAGFETGYLAGVDIRRDESAEGRGPTGTAIRLDKTIINDDTESNADYARWRETARAQGYRASAATPIRVDGQAVGALNVYRAEPNSFAAEDVVLLEKLAADLGYALQRQATEAELRTGRARLAEAQRIGRMGSWELDLVTNRVTWSEEIFRIFELDPARTEPSYRLFMDAVHPEDRDYVTQAYTDSVAYRTPYDIVHRLRMADRRIKYVREICETRYDPQGEPLRSLGSVQDITELKQVELQLREYQDHLEERIAERTRDLRQQAQIIDQIHDSVVSTDLDGVVVGWNKGAERMFGYPAAAALGRFVGFVYPEDELDFLRNQIIAPLQRQGAHEVEVRMRRSNGEEFFSHLSLSMLHDEQGAPRGMVGYSIDISARKRAEALLRQRGQELAAINQELESFSYSVSHDLRAPLRGIDGFSQALLEDYGASLDETAKDYLQRIRAGAQRMGALIDDLLKLSRVTRSRMEPSWVDLTALAGEVLGPLRQAEAQREAEVSVAPGMHAWGDPGLLRILLENLLDNAWKYSSKQARARIEFGRRKQDGKIVYYVRDNGVGFDMQQANKLFGAFQRLHHLDEFPGTGIGLATVQRVVHRHGGSVWATASPGAGASFHFTLAEPEFWSAAGAGSASGPAPLE